MDFSYMKSESAIFQKMIETTIIIMIGDRLCTCIRYVQSTGQAMG